MNTFFRTKQRAKAKLVIRETLKLQKSLLRRTHLKQISLPPLP